MTTNPELLSSVGKTAVGMAMVRAYEADQPVPLFRDPLARHFLEAFPEVFGAESAVSDEQAEIGAIFFSLGSLRTRFFDDYLLDATRAGASQVVLLGAGLDTRAFRLEWPPGVSLYEVDRADILTFKDTVLERAAASPGCDRRNVVADFRDPQWSEALTRAGFDGSAPCAFLAEGLLTYLAPEEALSLLDQVSQLASAGSRLAMEDERWTGELLERARAIPDMAEFASLWRGGGLGDGELRWMEERGWRTRTTAYQEVAKGYGRQLHRAAAGRYVVAVKPG